jgi:hypothetical protein
MASRRNFGKITAPKLHLSNYHKTQGKQPIVRILSSPLKNPGFPRVFRISGQFLWPSVAPMQLGAWRLRRCISRRAPQIESFFESRESLKHWGFECASLTPIHAGGGSRIRTSGWRLLNQFTVKTWKKAMVESICQTLWPASTRTPTVSGGMYSLKKIVGVTRGQMNKVAITWTNRWCNEPWL